MSQVPNMRPIIRRFDNFRSKKLTDSARDQVCQNCGAQDGTIVSAHANWAEYGKGGSMKAADCFIAHLCGRCHSWLDQGKGMDPTRRWPDTEKKEMWVRAHADTLHHLFTSGKLKVAA